MGIVNVTPDSFSDGGQHATVQAAIAHGLRLVEEGADILDIGGESTRPGSDAVQLDEELRRVIPVIEQLAAQTIEHVETCFQFGYDHKIIIDRAISFAYTLGKRGGRPKGSKDKSGQHRTRRSKQ